METGFNKNIFFCAGATEKDHSGRSEGVLAAVSFDRSMTLINETVFDEYNIEGCTALRRFEENDDIIVGCMKHLLIVTWNGNAFIVNNVIENVHTGNFLI